VGEIELFVQDAKKLEVKWLKAKGFGFAIFQWCMNPLHCSRLVH